MVWRPKEIHYLSAIEEGKYIIAQANAEMDDNGRLTQELVSARDNGETTLLRPNASSTWTWRRLRLCPAQRP